MKTRMTKLLLPLLVTVGALLTTSACVMHTQPVDAVYVAGNAPAHVYYGGRDLYYRTDGYYYYDRGSWLVAPAVPSYVTRYHRPTTRPVYYSRPSYSTPRYQGSYTRPVHVSSHSRPTYTRPVTSRPSTSRPVSSRPSATRPSTSRPSAGPTHVSRPSGSSGSSGPRRTTRR